MFADEAVLIADTYNDRLLRIWHIGAADPCPAEPSIGVAFDTDLFQERRDVAWRPEDHPQLDTGAFEALREIGYGIAHGRAGAEGPAHWRTRPFVLRAFSDGPTTAALFAVHRLGSGQERSTGFSFAAARFMFGSERAAEPKVVRDHAGEKAVEQTVWRATFA